MRKQLGFAIVLSLIILHPAFSVSEGLDNYCQASCGSNSPVSCSGTGSCTAVDQDCAAGQQGYVTCGSTTTYCSACPVDPPVEDCSQYNYTNCTYTWDPVSECCVWKSAIPGRACFSLHCDVS